MRDGASSSHSIPSALISSRERPVGPLAPWALRSLPWARWEGGGRDEEWVKWPRSLYSFISFVSWVAPVRSFPCHSLTSSSSTTRRERVQRESEVEVGMKGGETWELNREIEAPERGYADNKRVTHSITSLSIINSGNRGAKRVHATGEVSVWLVHSLHSLCSLHLFTHHPLRGVA